MTVAQLRKCEVVDKMSKDQRNKKMNEIMKEKKRKENKERKRNSELES